MTIPNLSVLYHRSTDVTLTLKDPHYPDHDLGIILLSVILTPKEGEPRDVVSLLELFLLPLAHVLRSSSGHRGTIGSRYGETLAGSTLGSSHPCSFCLFHSDFLS